MNSELRAGTPARSDLRTGADRRDATGAPIATGDDFRDAFTRIGAACAARRARIDARAVAYRHELELEAQSAAGLALARFIDRAARLGVDAASTLGFLPSRGRFPRAVYRAAHRACDNALRKMAREADHEREFDATAPAGFVPDGDADGKSFAVFAIHREANALREAIRAQGAANGNRARAARAHLQFIDRMEKRALQLARGEASQPLAAVTVAPAGRTVAASQTLAIYDPAGRPVATDGRGSAAGEKSLKRRGEARALFAKDFQALYRLREFLGEARPKADPLAGFVAQMLARSRELARPTAAHWLR